MPKIRFPFHLPQIDPIRIYKATVLLLGISVVTLGVFYRNDLALVASLNKNLTDLKNQDQYKINQELSARIKNIETTYKGAATVYELMVDYRTQFKKSNGFDQSFAEILNHLSQQNYATASMEIDNLTAKIKSEQEKNIAASLPPAAPTPQSTGVPVKNEVPGSGYSRQFVHTSGGDFMVDVVAGDLGSTKVIVDTASDSDCADNCPVMSLGSYVARSGAYAGVNGTYFCPKEYPSCAGKTNSYNFLVMNKNHIYFNSANNVYSNVPLVAFYGTTGRFLGAASGWGRDTGVDAVISNYPLLVSGGNVVASDGGDPKLAIKSNRAFVAAKGSTAYIGVTYNTTIGESAIVLQAMGIPDALNLDSGGSTAMWFGGYKTGPGRDIPNAVLFVRR